ncbi:MAG TPA: hypothetical protein VGR28_10805 [Candidatus Thermoplasmatota archaeon]|jgi:hypothetical protein|nr:hypothetical protein [Candidatus Thermoplasmatota archaeon]
MQKLALPAVALAALLAFANPVAATGAYGIGSLTYLGPPPCNPDTVPVVAVEDGAGGWVFVVLDLNYEANPGCAFVDAGVYDGVWNPATGGCLFSSLAIGNRICLTQPTPVAEGTRYTFSFDGLQGGTIFGFVTLTFF